MFSSGLVCSNATMPFYNLRESYQPDMKPGIDLCKGYFERTFEEGQDAIAFGWQNHIIVEPHPLTIQYGMRASLSVYTVPPITGPTYTWGDSLPPHQSSTQVMPSVVMIQAVEPRRNLYKRPHYFVLLWTRGRDVWAMIRVDAKADGTHPIARMHIVNGEMTLTVK